MSTILDYYQMGPNAKPSVLLRKRQGETGHTHRGQANVTVEAENGDVARGQRMLAATRSWRRPGTHSSPKPLEGVQPCPYLDFKLPALQTERINVCCFKLPSLP